MPELPNNHREVGAAYLPPTTPEHQTVVDAHDAIVTATELIAGQWELYDKPAIDADIAGTMYHIRLPHLRGGKHGAVAIMEWQDADGVDTSCVLRKAFGSTGLDDARAYLDHIRAEPSIAGIVPQLYGMVGDWAVMERLRGLELDEITERMAADPAFIDRYAEQTYALIARMSRARVSFNDVRFINGHNVMADPETGAVRLVEQPSLEPGAYREPNELIATQLFTELEALVSPNYKTDQGGTPRDQVRRRYAYSLMKQAAHDIDPQELYVRTRLVGPDHPGYRSAWFFQNWQQLSDRQYQAILDNFHNGQGYPLVNYDGRGFTEALSPEFIEALHADDFDTFVALIAADKYKADVTDEADPRYKSVLLRHES